MTDIATISALPLGAFFGDKPPLHYRDGKPILTINGVEHDAEALLLARHRQLLESIDLAIARPQDIDAELLLSWRDAVAALQEPRHDR